MFYICNIELYVCLGVCQSKDTRCAFREKCVVESTCHWCFRDIWSKTVNLQGSDAHQYRYFICKIYQLDSEDDSGRGVSVRWWEGHIKPRRFSPSGGYIICIFYVNRLCLQNIHLTHFMGKFFNHYGVVLSWIRRSKFPLLIAGIF